MRRLAVAPIALSLSLALGCSLFDDRPNVVLVTVDTLRADRVSAYGYELPTTPAIDALASEGVLFERAIAASSATAPSHATILTSRRVREHSVSYFNGRSRLVAPDSLAPRFRAAGWATGAFVGNYMLQPRTGFDAGFDVFDSELEPVRLDEMAIFERGAEATSERALAWLRAQREGPFFLWFHLQDPHGPYLPPNTHFGLFEIERRPDEWRLPVLEDRFGYHGVPSYQVVEGAEYPSDYEALYADEIRYADDAIGRLLAAVDTHPSGRPTVVLLTSDHGESMGEGGYYYVHSHVTTPDIAHVPMVLRAPGIPAGRRSELVGHVDVLPTLLELAGLPPDEEARGIALGPYLRSGEPLPDRTLICDMGSELAAYQGDGFVRLVEVAPALLDPGAVPTAPAGGAPERPSWGRRTRVSEGPRWWGYRWSGNGRDFEPAPDVAALPEAVQRYLEEKPVRTTFIDHIRPADLERLRALGYW
jgi:arylsulfatase A-like enzyme